VPRGGVILARGITAILTPMREILEGNSMMNVLSHLGVEVVGGEVG